MRGLHRRTGFARALAVYLALALLPTPLVLSWLLTRPSSASATADEDSAAPPTLPLTDIAPPQPFLPADPAEEPAARLARLGLQPVERTAAEQAAAFAPRFSSAAEAREAQRARLESQLGDRQRAEEVLAELARSISPSPSVFVPHLAPVVPDPFVPLPARADYKRSAR